jgi:aspartyl-tRNA(Asn)/glutamyl-tRNA(Gln) amidotransferase subunit B
LQREFNPKVEVKNMNSFRSVERAIQFEIERQTALYSAGASVVSETRGWDDARNETISQRSKETNADYRYFPEPDLPDIDLICLREEERSRLPELPAETRLRLQDEYAFSKDDARLIVERGWTTFAEQTMSELGGWLEARDASGASGGELLASRQADAAKLLSNWLLNKLAGLLAERGTDLADAKIDAENMAEFLQIVSEGTLNSTNAQKLLALMLETGADPSHLLEEHSLGQMSDTGAIEQTIRDVIAANPTQAEQVRGGKEAVLKWFVGQVMKATEGRIDPKSAEDMLRKELLG